MCSRISNNFSSDIPSLRINLYDMKNKDSNKIKSNDNFLCADVIKRMTKKKKTTSKNIRNPKSKLTNIRRNRHIYMYIFSFLHFTINKDKAKGKNCTIPTV